MTDGPMFREDKSLEYSSVQKAIQLLLSFIPENEAVGNLQLSEKLGLNKSTVSRLMQVLIHYGLIQQDNVSKKYELGKTAAMLGAAVEVSQFERIAEIAKPYIENLRDVVEESVAIEMLSSGRSAVIAKALGPPPLSVNQPDFLNLHVSASAKVLLAFSDEAFVDSVLPDKMEKFTEKTIVDKEQFKDHLREIRDKGLGYDLEEANEEVCAMAAPIFNHLKRPVAAICICVPAYRVEKIERKESEELLLKTAGIISERLFYRAGEGG